MGPVDAFDWRAAEVLRASDATGAGHLVHMPTHLYIQVGRYIEAMRCNMMGYRSDLTLAARSPQRFGIYTGYVVHNMEFCVWAAMYAGCQRVALEAAAAIDAFFTEERLRSAPFLPTFFEAYSAVPLMVLVRFGLWERILATPLPRDPSLYVAKTLFTHFARGLALGIHAHTLADARRSQEAFLDCHAALKPKERLHHNVDLTQMAAIAESVLEGELAYRAAEAAAVPRKQLDSLREDRSAGYADDDLRLAGYSARDFRGAGATMDEVRAAGFSEVELQRAGYLGAELADHPTYDVAFAALERAVTLFDNLPYDEPHGWLMSARQTLGALLTEQGRWVRAIEVYEEDLALFPDNPWALAGLKRCFAATGDPRRSAIEQKLCAALEAADVPIDVSCACARRRGA